MTPVSHRAPRQEPRVRRKQVMLPNGRLHSLTGPVTNGTRREAGSSGACEPQGFTRREHSTTPEAQRLLIKPKREARAGGEGRLWAVSTRGRFLQGHGARCPPSFSRPPRQDRDRFEGHPENTRSIPRHTPGRPPTPPAAHCSPGTRTCSGAGETVSPPLRDRLGIPATRQPWTGSRAGWGPQPLRSRWGPHHPKCLTGSFDPQVHGPSGG